MNKFTKLLSVFIIAGAIGAGVAGVSACKNNDDSGSEGPGYGQEDNLITAENATGIMTEWEGGLADITLSETLTTASLDLSKLKVYYKKDSTKGTEVPAIDYEVTVGKDGTPITTYTGLKQGHYEVLVEVGNWEASDEFDILNPVKAGSLVVKTGTLTQDAGVDTIKSTWTYEVTRANGDKQDVLAADVTVSNYDSMVAGTDKEATLSCTIDGATVTGKVNYTITADATKVTQSFALNFSALTAEQENAIKAQSENTHNPLSLQDGRFEVCSTKSGEIASHGKSFDGKYFAKRLKMNAASTAAKCPRYIKVHADGPAMLTVYAYCNTGSEGTVSDRKVAVYGAMTVTDENPTASFTQQVGESQATTEKTDTKHTFTITEAGDYYIVSEVNGICFTYVQLDQQVSSDGNTAITLGGDVVASSVSATHSSGKSAHVALGTTFESIKSAYTVKILGVNNVTCDSGETDVTTDAKVTYEVPEDFEAAIGEKVITIKYDNLVSTTVKVYVESNVSGIYGMTSALGSEVSTQVAAGSKLTLKKSDIINTLLGASDNEAAQISSYTVTYNDTEITEEGVEFEISATAYTITVTATVSDGTSNDTLTATIEFTVEAASTSPTQSFIAPDELPATTAIAANGVITENNLFKAVADGAMEYTVGKDTSAGIPNSSKPVTATLQDGTSKTFKSAIRTVTAGKTASDTVSITAKEKITLKVYAVFSNSSFNSNKTGKLNYQIGEAAATQVDTGSNRQQPNTVTVTLEAGETLKLWTSDGSDNGHMYLFGIEATQVTE